MKKKRMLLLTGCTMLLLSACSTFGGEKTSSNKGGSGKGDTIVIGGNFELSGAVAEYGGAESDGVKLAIKEINDAGGVLKKKLEYVYKDNKSEDAESTSVTTNLATKENAVAIIGPATSGGVKAATSSLSRAKIPLITPSGTDEGVTLDNNGKVQPYVFRTCFQDSFQGVTLANFAYDTLKAEKAVIIGDNSSDYGKGLTETFKKQYKGKVVVEENFASGETDFRAILTNVKDKDFDVLYIPGYYNEAGLLIKQAREMGITQPILGADGFGDSKLVELAGAANVTNVYYTSHFSPNADNEKVQSFVKAFKDEYGKEPNQFNALAYDAVYMAKQALEEAGEADPEKITEALANIKDFEGVTGTISMDENHNPIKSIIVVKLDQGKEVEATVVEP